MKKLWFILSLVFALATPLQAAEVIVSRDTFQVPLNTTIANGGTLPSGKWTLSMSGDTTPLRIRPIGATTTGDTVAQSLEARYPPYFSSNPASPTNAHWELDQDVGTSASNGYFVAFDIYLDERSRTEDNASAQFGYCKIFGFYDGGGNLAPVILFHPGTNEFIAQQDGGTAGVFKSFGYCKQVHVCVAILKLGSAQFSERVYYKRAEDSSYQLWLSVDNRGLAGTYPVVGKFGDGYNGSGENWLQRWEGRLGGITTGTFTSFSDLAYQSNWQMATETPHKWFVRRTSTSTPSAPADGLTWATAWSVAQMNDELATGGTMSPQNPWLYKASQTAVSSSIDVRDFDAGVSLGMITHAGDQILVDPEGQQIHTTSFGIGVNCSGVKFAPYNASQVVWSYTTVASGWSNAGTSDPRIFRTASTPTVMFLWDNDKWLNYIEASTGSAVQTGLLSSGQVSFGCDGTYIYLFIPDGSNPNTNGHIYEYCVNGGSFFDSAPNSYVLNMTFWKGAAIHNADFSWTDGVVDSGPAYPFGYTYSGLTRFENISAGYGGKHCFGAAGDPTYPTGCRVVLKNCRAFQVPPPSMLSFGAATTGVFYTGTSTGDSSDNQILFDGWDSTINCGVIGSALGQTEATQPGFYTHCDGKNQISTWSPTSGAPGLIFRNFKSSTTGHDTNISMYSNRAFLYMGDSSSAVWGSSGPWTPPQGITYSTDTMPSRPSTASTVHPWVGW